MMQHPFSTIPVNLVLQKSLADTANYHEKRGSLFETASFPDKMKTA